MLMGALNSHSTFCAMMDKLKGEWNVCYEIQGGVTTTSNGKVIVDDIMLYSDSEEELLKYF